MLTNWQHSPMRDRTRQENEEGFTLAELLVVIMIIGILAALIIPSVVDAGCRARSSATQSKIENIQTALKSYKTDHGKYPEETREAGSEPLVKALSKKKGRGTVYMEFDEEYLKGSDEQKKLYSSLGQQHEAYEIHYALPRGEHFQNRWKYEGEHPSPSQLNQNQVNLWTAGCDFAPDSEDKSHLYQINNFRKTE